MRRRHRHCTSAVRRRAEAGVATREDAMRDRSKLVVWGLAAAFAALGCQGAPIPLSAQKGSTLLIPLGGIDEADAGRIGFGSQAYQDRQRGALVFKLGGPDGPELVTRATTALSGPLASTHGIGAPFGYRTDLVVSLVDIPDTEVIPEGVHTLHVTRRLGGVDLPGPEYAGEIAILPATVGAVTGVPTPFEALGGPAGDLTPMIRHIVPDPQALFAFDGSPLRAFEGELTFPDALVAIRDVTEMVSTGALGSVAGVSESHRAHVWWRVLAPGRVAVGMLSPDRALRGISVVFTHKAGATAPVAPTAFTLASTRAYDADGNASAAGWIAPWIR
jgi:hypothetical protein